MTEISVRQWHRLILYGVQTVNQPVGIQQQDFPTASFAKAIDIRGHGVIPCGIHLQQTVVTIAQERPRHGDPHAPVLRPVHLAHHPPVQQRMPHRLDPVVPLAHPVSALVRPEPDAAVPVLRDALHQVVGQQPAPVEIRTEHLDLVTVVPAQSVHRPIPDVTLTVLIDTVDGVHRQPLECGNARHLHRHCPATNRTQAKRQYQEKAFHHPCVFSPQKYTFCTSGSPRRGTFCVKKGRQIRQNTIKAPNCPLLPPVIDAIHLTFACCLLRALHFTK